MVYAPWCGHCKNLKPTWEKVAGLLKKYKNNGVRMAKYDNTANESNDMPSVRSYPSLFYYVKGEPIKNVKTYDGGRTVKDIVEFIKANTKSKWNDIPEDELK